MKPHDNYSDPEFAEHETIKEIRDVEPGDALNLYGDTFADPTHDRGAALQFEYTPVLHKEKETPGCIRLDFQGYDSVGFPPDHRVIVVERSYFTE